MSGRRARILFVSENVTLAQVVRLIVLARALPADQYEVHFACSEFDPLCFAGTDFVQHRLFTIDPKRVSSALESGKRIYEASMLERYVRAELELFVRVRPHLVVGDFRLSLPISAPHFGVPHAALINAYWSPYAVREGGFPVPDHPIVRLLGEELAQRYFPKAIPRVFSHFAKPVNTVRERYGLAPVGSLLEVLTQGDHTLYADVPELTPLEHAPATHRFLGPVLWAPHGELPPAWAGASDVARVYVTLGSSGNVAVMPALLAALSKLPVRALLATAGRAKLGALPPNIEVARFVPGDEAARRAALVITNGGSSTGYQALAEGVPVVGIASNFDQYLAMAAIERAGAGVLVRAGNVTAAKLTTAIGRVLEGSEYRARAQALAVAMSRMNAAERFRAFVAEALSRAGQAQAQDAERRAVPA